MEAFLVSTLVVAIGEIGDKTQLLALLLAARFRKPMPIILGILVATLANHGLAGLLGTWVSANLAPDTLRWGLGISFLAIAAWALKPDKIDEEPSTLGHYGVFFVTLIAFFLAEIGDKTQLATIALAAKYQALPAVVAGTTLGMMLANAPVVWFGERVTRLLPLVVVHRVSALIFAVLALLVIWTPF